LKDIFHTLKENNYQPILVYPAKLSFLIEREVNNFHNKQKLKEFMTTKPVLQKIIKGLLQTEEETKASGAAQVVEGLPRSMRPSTTKNK
jgi:hypothetical protein